jgi:tetratricopeptide (TPR) repeat protein
VTEMNNLVGSLGTAALISILSPAQMHLESTDLPIHHSLQSVLLAQANPPEFKLEDFDFWANQCVALGEQREYEQAIAACEQAIALQPRRENITIWTARGNALFHLGRYSESLNSYNQVVAAAPKSSLAITYQCANFLQMGRAQEAIDTCQQALTIDGSWGDRSPGFAWYYRGLALRELNNLEMALDSFQRALMVNSDDPLAIAGCVETVSELGPLDQLNATCRLPAEATGATAPLPTTYPQALQKTVDAYDRALAVEPDDALLWVQQGRTLDRLGQYERALTSYDRAVAIAPKRASTLSQRCAVLNHLEKYDAALTTCESAFQGDGGWGSAGSAHAWNQQSVALTGLGRYPEALAAADRAVAIASDDAAAWNQRSLVLLRLERYPEALAAADRATTTNPSYPEGWNSKAVSLWQLKNFSGAIAAIQKATDSYRQIQRRLEDTSGRANSASPPLPESLPLLYRGEILAWFNWGRILASSQDYQTATQKYRQAIATYTTAVRKIGINPLSNATLSQIWLSQGIAYSHLAYSHLEDWEQAESSVQQAVNLDNSSFEAWYNLGLVLIQRHKYDKNLRPEQADDLLQRSLQAYETADRLQPNNVYVLTGQGMVLEELCRTRQAIVAYTQALSLAPNYTFAQTQLNRLNQLTQPPIACSLTPMQTPTH